MAWSECRLEEGASQQQQSTVGADVAQAHADAEADGLDGFGDMDEDQAALAHRQVPGEPGSLEPDLEPFQQEAAGGEAVLHFDRLCRCILRCNVQPRAAAYSWQLAHGHLQIACNSADMLYFSCIWLPL